MSKKVILGMWTLPSLIRVDDANCGPEKQCCAYCNKQITVQEQSGMKDGHMYCAKCLNTPKVLMGLFKPKAAASAPTQASAAPPTALARLGSPEEDIAPVVLFLASKDAQFLTGYSLSPDGGMIIDRAR